MEAGCTSGRFWNILMGIAYTAFKKKIMPMPSGEKKVLCDEEKGRKLFWQYLEVFKCRRTWNGRISHTVNQESDLA